MAMNIGDRVTIPAGTRMGMGVLRSDVTGTIDAVERDESGAVIYGIRYEGRRGARHTWMSAGQVRACRT